MCIGGGGKSDYKAPPPAPPAPTPVTVTRLSKRARPKDRFGKKRRRGSSRDAMVIRRASSGVSSQSSGTGVNY